MAGVMLREAVANNESLGILYNKGLPKTGLLYFDATNLYGWAMEQDMPVGEFYHGSQRGN